MDVYAEGNIVNHLHLPSPEVPNGDLNLPLNAQTRHIGAHLSTCTPGLRGQPLHRSIDSSYLTIFPSPLIKPSHESLHKLSLDQCRLILAFINTRGEPFPSVRCWQNASSYSPESQKQDFYPSSGSGIRNGLRYGDTIKIQPR